MIEPNPDGRALDRMESWTNAACLIPLCGVPLAWTISYILYYWIIRCGGGSLFDCEERALLRPLRDLLGTLDLDSNEVVRATFDVAARFSWHPTLIAFVVVALGAIAACWYLAYRSLVESLRPEKGRAAQWNLAIGAAAVLTAVLGWSLFPQWIIRTEVLTPILDAAFGPNSVASDAAETVQRLFQTLAFLASCFVVAAASAALLTPRGTGNDDSNPSLRERTTHLADQWRRLSFTLYAGAALLVAAVVHQTALYGWGQAFATAVVQSREDSTRFVLARLDTARIDLDIARARFAADTVAAKGIRLDTLRMEVARQAYQVAALKSQVERDTLATRTDLRALDATMTRVGDVISTAITRGGGLVYSILLAMTYLPAALVLMERARELSIVVSSSDPEPTESGRATWRAQQGIAFSIGTQWSKVVAVLSPLLASGGAAYLFRFFQ